MYAQKYKTYSRIAHAIRWVVEVWNSKTNSLEDEREFETETAADTFIEGVLS